MKNVSASHHRKLAAGLLIGAIAAAVGSARPAAAASLSALVPADGLAYIEWSGSDHRPASYATSNLAGILEATDLRAQITEAIDKKLAQDPDHDRPDNVALTASLKKLAALLEKHPTAIYLLTLDLSDPQHPTPIMALLVDGEADAASVLAEEGKVMAVVKAQQALHPDQHIPDVDVAAHGTVVILTVGKLPELADTLAGKGTTLAKEPTFATLVTNSPDALARGWVGTAGVWNLIDQAVQAKNDPAATQRWTQARSLLNLDAFGPMTFSSQLSGKDFNDRWNVSLPADRAKWFGIATLLDNEPISLDVLKTIPVAANFGGVMRLNFKKALDEARAVAQKMGAQPAQQFDMGLQMASSYTGVQIERDLFGSLGDAWIYYSATAEHPVQGLTLVNHLSDAKRGADALGDLQDFANNMMGRQGGSGPQFVGKDVDGLTINTLTLPNAAPSWTVDDKGNFIFGVNPDAVTAAIAQIKAPDKSILDAPAFAAGLKATGIDKPVTVDFSDFTVSAPRIYARLNDALQQQAHDVNGFTIELPPFEKVAPFFADEAVAAATVDDSGVHLSIIEPFPGAMLFDGQQNAMQALHPPMRRPRQRGPMNGPPQNVPLPPTAPPT